MVKKIRRLAVTLWYVRPVQLFCQVWFRLKKQFISFRRYTAYDASVLTRLKFGHAAMLIPAKDKYRGGNEFCFIGIAHRFEGVPDWNFNSYGKLWNYNLQYFDYLGDNTMPMADRRRLLHDFSAKLLSGSVEPEPYPVSLRIINTLIFLSTDTNADPLTEAVLKKQVDYLENNLEYHILANHLLENIFALFIAAFALESRKLYDKSVRLLETQLREQILVDGAHYECSPMYHSIILSRVLLCIDIAENNGRWPAPLFLRDTAAVMLGWLDQYSFRESGWESMNDAAPDIAADCDALVATAADMNIRPMYVLLGESGYRRFNRKNYQLLVDVGDIRPSYQPGHAHADMLSFSLYAKGGLVFADTGTSTYQNNLRRNLERSTPAHNTVSINNDNQSDIWSAFRVAHRARVGLHVDTADTIRASHDGYRAKYGALHTRSFLMTGDDRIIIEDAIDGSLVDVTAHFHLDYKLQVVDAGENTVLLSNGTSIIFKNATEVSVRPYLQANGFNRLFDASEIVVTFNTTLISEIRI